MVTAEELVVSITSSGVNETREDLEGVENTMENTADTAGDAAEELEGFSQRFAGALSAAVAGLAVGMAGLASSVPIAGELFAGFAAILDALLFQVDQLARDMGIGGLTGVLFKVAGVIYELDGVAGDLVGVLAVVATAVISAGAAVAAWAVKTMGVVAAAGKLVAALKIVGGAIAAIIGGITATTAALALAVAAIVGFAVAYLTNWRGVRDKTNNIIGDIVDFVVGGFMNLASTALEAVSGFASDVFGFFSDLASDLAEWAGGVASGAREWGVSIIQNMIDGMISLAGSIAEAVQNVINGMIDVINTALDQLPEEVTSRVGVEQFGRVDFDSDFGTTGGSGGGGGGSPSFRGRGGSVGTRGATLDGRQISESTGRYRSDPGRRRGI